MRIKKTSRTASSKNAVYSKIKIEPMMPRQFSARQRQEIRQKELQILRGLSK